MKNRELRKNENNKNLTVIPNSFRDLATVASNGGQMLKQVQHDSSKGAFTLAEPTSRLFNLRRQSKVAFTLAEVLITLGVIGVVAAMTLPMLISNYNNKVTITRLKKFYSVINQTVQRLQADYGDTNNWDYVLDNVFLENGERKDQSSEVAEKFKQYFGKYIDFVSDKEVEYDDGLKGHLFYMKDGSAIMTRWANNIDYEFFPKNADKCIKKANYERYGVCSFMFQFISTKRNEIFAKPPIFIPYAWEYREADMGSLDKLYNHTKYGCSNGQGHYCGIIIMLNNWTVPQNYPKKISY